MAAVTEVPEYLLILMRKGYFNDQCSIKIGERVIKSLCEEGDFNPEGTEGMIVGNIYHPMLGEGYLVVFDGLGGLEVFAAGVKIKRI